MCFILVVNLASLYKSKSKCKTNRQSTFRIAQRKRDTERVSKNTNELTNYRRKSIFYLLSLEIVQYCIWAANFQMVDFYFYLMVFLAVLSLKCSISHKNAVELLAFPSKINIKPNLITFDAGRKKYI